MLLHNTPIGLLPTDFPDVRRSIVDTSTLMVFLGLSFVANQPKELTLSQRNDIFGFIGKPDFADNNSRQHRYQHLFTSIREIITTSHVVGELNSHITRGFKNNSALRENFLRHTLQMLTEKHLQETLITVHEVSINERYNDIITRIGIVDMGLLILAQKLALPLFTEVESTLGAEAHHIPDIHCFALPWYF